MQFRAVRSLDQSSDVSTAAAGREFASPLQAKRQTPVHLVSTPDERDAEFSPSSRGSLGGSPNQPPVADRLWIERCLVAICCCLGIGGGSVQALDQNNILLDFSATWCGPCQQMSPIVSKLERQGFPIRKVDVDQEAALAQKYHVEEIPCFVLIANGREINRLTGKRDERELRQLMNMLPKQNLDEPLVGKSARNSANTIPPTNGSSKSSDERKPLAKLFGRNQDSKNGDSKLTPTEPDTIRGQNPSLEATMDSFSRELLMVSTRIRVKDGTRLHYGSGTIIESRAGRSIILTCSHIFRDLGSDATIEVDVYQAPNSKPQTVLGHVLKVDPKADIGLLAVATETPLPSVKLCDVKNGPSPKDRVMSIGCGGGQRPTCEDLTVTGINKFTGPDNIECTGVPQQGRSGGGLFLGPELVGVCIAADPAEKRGIYTALKPVAELLNKVRLGHLAQSYLPQDESVAATESATLGAPVDVKETPSRGHDDEFAEIVEAATRATGSAMNGKSPDLVGAEIVCIVRPKTPGAVSRVVIVNQASSRFVDDLLHESGGGRRESTTAGRTKAEKLPAAESTNGVSRLAMQKPTINGPAAIDSSRQIETSFEPQRYRRNRD